ncbi:MAG: STAS domain-containing protein [Planctomycetales bacterium]
MVDSSEAPYRFETLDTYSILSFYPLINEGQWGNVSEVGTEILNRLETIRSPAVVVDLSPLDYMGSAQVALLVRIWKSLKKMQGKMVVQCPGAMVREVLTIAGLKSLWNIVETREAALKSLNISERSLTMSTAPGAASGLGTLMTLIALVGAVGAAAVLVMKMQGSTANKTALLIMEIAFAQVGLIAGIGGGFLGRGIWRALGLLSALVCIGSMIVYLVKFLA